MNTSNGRPSAEPAARTSENRVLNAFTTCAPAGAALAISCAPELPSGVTKPLESGVMGLVMSTMTLPARAFPYWATTGTTLAYPRATMTMSPAGTAPNSPVVALPPRALARSAAFVWMAAEALDGVAARHCQRADSAGHVPGADDADVAHEMSSLDC